MAKQNFRLEDIKKFLNDQLKYYWCYDIYDYDTILFRKATIEDFDNAKPRQISVIKNMSKQNLVDFKTIEFADCWVTVDNDKFIVKNSGDYSQRWQEFLALKYEEAYEHSNS